MVNGSYIFKGNCFYETCFVKVNKDLKKGVTIIMYLQKKKLKHFA